MKKLLVALLALVALSLSGCMSSDTISSASTKLQVSDPSGKSFAFTFPKELDAKQFKLSMNASTGDINLTADAITSSSQGVINSAANAQAQAMADMAKTVSAVVSAVVPIATQVALPAKIATAEIPK